MQARRTILLKSSYGPEKTYQGVMIVTKEKRVVKGEERGDAVHWAGRNPDRVLGVVSVDGAHPYGVIGEEGRERIRTLFHRMRWMFPLASRLALPLG